MNSNLLLKSGFKNFGEFDCATIKTRAKELKKTGVYAFVLNKKFQRLKGETDILYIGQAGGGSHGERPIFKRMMDYCKVSKSAPRKRIGKSPKNITTKERIGIALKKLDRQVLLFYKPVNKNQCRKKESDLLVRYSKDHIELQPLNRRG